MGVSKIIKSPDHLAVLLGQAKAHEIKQYPFTKDFDEDINTTFKPDGRL